MILKKLWVVPSQKKLYEAYLRMFLVLHEIKLQPKIEAILSYFLQYGFSQSTYQKILEDGVVPSMQSINNAKSVLVDKGLLSKTSKWSLSGGLENLELDNIFHVVLRCTTDES